MKRGKIWRGFVLLLLCQGLMLAVMAAPATAGGNWYVRPGGAGAKTGTDWNNASDITAIPWSSVKPGDTIWLAGGTYANSPFVPGASGAAGNLIFIKRVLATDAIPAAAAGWSASFDSQVIVTNTTANNKGSNCSAGDVLCFNSSSMGNFTYWDGRVDSGISLRTSNISGLSPTNNTTPGQSALDLGTFPGNNGTGSNHDITFTNIDFAGPAGAATFTHASYDAAVMVRMVTANVLITNCRIHGANNNVWLDLSSGVIFEHTKFYDNVASGSSAGHPNMVQYAGNSNITFRYNDWSNWNTEGLMSWTSGGSLFVYGNVFHDAFNGAFPSVIQAQAPTGPLFFYNNTIANVNGYCVFRPNSPNDWKSGSQARNNIYWNSAVCAQDAPADSDYDAVFNDSTASVGAGDTLTVTQIEAHASTLPASPFVNAAAGNFQLLADTPAGFTLAAPYNVDEFGTTRGANGVWDRGAFQLGGSSSSLPAAPQGIHVVAVQ
ncbi:MAG: right-handed parallel beta-helix repeat-containing protein [Acidobacteriia bacterium]|nr:right-handed parallel beta-helix repeat-containing protein [Terriglobia bacterium]